MMLGKKLAAYRKQKGLTQQQLGEYLNVSAQAVSKWENDQAEPDLFTISKLAALYQISVDSMLTGKDFEILEASQPTQQAEEEFPVQAAEEPIQVRVIKVKKEKKEPSKNLKFIQKHKLPILLATLALVISLSSLIAFFCGAFDRQKPNNMLDRNKSSNTQTGLSTSNSNPDLEPDPDPEPEPDPDLEPNPEPDPDLDPEPDPDPDPDPEPDSEPDSEPDPKPEPPSISVLNLIIKGETDYVIVRDYQASEAIISAVYALATSIQNNIGATVTIKECFNNREEAADVKAAKEILIGMTNREESINALSTMRSKDYTICEKNGKMVIGGGGDIGTLMAITRFINDFVVEQGSPFAVKQGEKQSLIFSNDKTVNEVGSYSYTSAHIMGVSLDNFGIIYPKYGEYSEDCKSFAKDLSAYISDQSGYELPVLSDITNWADFEIRIGYAEGNVDKHDPGDGCVCSSLAANEYCIKLVKTQVTYEDGTLHDGARLYICFGSNAKDAAYKAFTEQIMPILREPTVFTMDEGFELNNCAA